MNDPLRIFLGSFSEKVTLGLTGTPRVIDAIFDNAFYDQSLGQTTLDTTAPRITALDTDLVGVARGQSITVRGTAYDVLQVQPDGTGFSTVILAHAQ